MKVWRLVSGILSMLMFFIVMIQSCATGFVNIMEDNMSDTSGVAGFFVAFGLLASGIVSTALCRNKSKGGSITLMVLFGLTALLGFANLGTFEDLLIWSFWALFCAVMAIVALIKNAMAKDEEVLEYEFVSTPTIANNENYDAKNECPNCHATIDAGSAFCGSCGQKLLEQTPARRFCRNCGTQLEPDTLFCPNCGTKQ